MFAGKNNWRRIGDFGQGQLIGGQIQRNKRFAVAAGASGCLIDFCLHFGDLGAHPYRRRRQPQQNHAQDDFLVMLLEKLRYCLQECVH